MSRSEPMSNEAIASILDRVADRLHEQRANPYRVDAYHAGAQVVRSRSDSVQQLALTGGRLALDALPRIGASLAASIDEIAHTGGLRFLNRLEGRVSPIEVFRAVPGIGEGLAERIHRELRIDTLEALEEAAGDGRLAAVSGFGPRRLQATRDIVAAMLRGSPRRGRPPVEPAHDAPQPPVTLLLAVDQLYQEGVQARTLPTVAPRRHNPDGAAWLPVLHVGLDGYDFTAMFSNTDRAHELGRTRDWVVIYCERAGRESQFTAVTEYKGRLAGRRVVRGREMESGLHYEAGPPVAVEG